MWLGEKSPAGYDSASHRLIKGDLAFVVFVE